MREFDLRTPVCSYLLAREYFPAVEFWLHNGGCCDIVAGKYADRVGRSVPNLLRVVAVELKLEKVGEALGQAKRNAPHCDWSYVAMPSDRVRKLKCSTRLRFRKEGIGLIEVHEDLSEVVEVIAPKHQATFGYRDKNRKKLWRRVRKLHAERTK